MVAATPSPLGALETACRALLIPHVPEGTPLVLQRPSRPEHGDLSCAVALSLAKVEKRPPMAVAEAILAGMDLSGAALVREVRIAQPGFINFYANYDALNRLVIDSVAAYGAAYGRPPDVEPRHVVVEHTSVNPNKPWHIGHVRNAVLGDVLGRLFRFAGHHVEIQNYIDDTGKQVADMLFGLRHAGVLGPGGAVAVPPGVKADHFFGEYYVRINRLVAEGVVEKQAFEAGSMALMQAREDGAYRGLVHEIVLAQLATAWRLGIFYDLLIWEGDIIQAHLFEEAVERLLASPRVYLQTEGRHAGCLVIDMGEFLPEGAGETGVDHPTERVLIRSNELPTYTAKDIAYHMWKFGLLGGDLRFKVDTVQPNGAPLWSSAPDGAAGALARPPVGELINVIDVRQALAQRVVHAALQVTGHPEAAAAHHHLAYGVVSPRGGAFSGRKGTEYSADGVLDAVVAAQEARATAKAAERGIEVPEAELRATSEVVAVAALRYLMCRYDPLRDVQFTVEDVIDERGVTALYIQYAYARAQSIFRRGGYLREGDREVDAGAWRDADLALLTHSRERALVLLIARLPVVITQVIEGLAVHTLADYAHELAESFSLFYEACPVLRSDVPEDLRAARLALAAATARVMRNVAGLLGIALPERL